MVRPHLAAACGHPGSGFIRGGRAWEGGGGAHDLWAEGRVPPTYRGAGLGQGPEHGRGRGGLERGDILE